jgi:hypothetical protein
MIERYSWTNPPFLGLALNRDGPDRTRSTCLDSVNLGRMVVEKEYGREKFFNKKSVCAKHRKWVHVD